MARSTYGNVPLDQPIEERPGVMVREADAPGNAKHMALPPEAPERAEKGDLGNLIIPGFEPRPLQHPGLPYVIMGEK